MTRSQQVDPMSSCMGDQTTPLKHCNDAHTGPIILVILLCAEKYPTVQRDCEGNHIRGCRELHCCDTHASREAMPQGLCCCSSNDKPEVAIAECSNSAARCCLAPYYQLRMGISCLLA